MVLYKSIHGVDLRVAPSYQRCASTINTVNLIVDSDSEEQIPHRLVPADGSQSEVSQLAVRRGATATQPTRGRPSAKMKKMMYEHVRSKDDAIRLLGAKDKELEASKEDARNAREELTQLKRRVRARSAPPPNRGSLSIVQSSSDLNKPCQLTRP